MMNPLGYKKAENLAWELRKMNLQKIEEHSYLVVQNLLFVVEIPSALEEAVDEMKLEELKLDLQEAELVVDQQAEHVLMEPVSLREIVVMENAGKVQQLGGYMLVLEKIQMDH